MKFIVDTSWEKDACIYMCGNSGLGNNQAQVIIRKTSSDGNKDESKIPGFIRSHLF